MICFKLFHLETAVPDIFVATIIHLCCHVYHPQVPKFSVFGACPHGSSDCTLSLCPELPAEVTPTEVTPSTMGTDQTCSCTQQLTTQPGQTTD